MLRIIQLEELEDLLLQVPALVRRQEQRSSEFSSEVRVWLTALEEALSANRLSQASQVAALRSALTSAEHGLIPLGLSFRGRPTRSRVLHAAAADALRQATALISGLVQENRARIEEAERIARQVVAAARVRGLLVPNPGGMAHANYLRALRQMLSANPELENALAHLEGLVGPHDTLIILDRVLGPQAVGAPPSGRPAADAGRPTPIQRH